MVCASMNILRRGDQRSATPSGGGCANACDEYIFGYILLVSFMFIKVPYRKGPHYNLLLFINQPENEGTC